MKQSENDLFDRSAIIASAKAKAGMEPERVSKPTEEGTEDDGGIITEDNLEAEVSDIEVEGGGSENEDSGDTDGVGTDVDGDDTTDSGSDQEVTLDADVAKQALVDGDFSALAQALGVDPRAVETSARKIAYVRKTAKEAKEITSRNAQVQKDLISTYGDVRQAKIDFDGGNVLSAVDTIEKVFGSDFNEIIAQVLELQDGQVPKDHGLSKREKALAAKQKEFEDSKKKIAETYERERQVNAAVGAVSQQLKGHQYMGVKNAAKNVVDLMISSWDGEKYTLSNKQAADQLLDEAIERAAALGIKSPSKVKKVAARKPIKALPRTVKKASKRQDDYRASVFSEDKRAQMIAEARRKSGK